MNNFKALFVFLGLMISINTFNLLKMTIIDDVVSKSQNHNFKLQCKNKTHFNFQNQISLAKNDEMNITLAQINKQINQLQDIEYKINDSITYKLTNIRPTLRYRDQYNIVEILGGDVILILNGSSEVSVNFTWEKYQGQRLKNSGNLLVYGQSDQFMYVKDLYLEQNIVYGLLDYLNVTFSQEFKIVNQYGDNMTEQNKVNVMKLVNTININNVTNIRQRLIDQINVRLYKQLYKNIIDYQNPYKKQFSYKWINSNRQQFIIEFVRNYFQLYLEKNGIYYSYQTSIKNWAESKCGLQIPRIPFNPKVYGDSQQFISYTFYQNVLNYAIKKGILNTILKKQNWSSKVFNFNAGQLYNVVPEIASKISPNTELNGYCAANTADLRVYKENSQQLSSFNVFFSSNCDLRSSSQKIIDFDINLNLKMEAIPSDYFLDFKLKSHSQTINYNDENLYKIYNKGLANQMISRSIDRLYESKLFGSGWETYSRRDNPEFQADYEYTIVYDANQI